MPKQAPHLQQGVLCLKDIRCSYEHKHLLRPALSRSRNRRCGKVAALLRNNPELICGRDNNGNTPLHWAAEYGHTNVAALLLGNKAHVNAKNSNCDTPLHLAVDEDHDFMVKFLLTKGAEVNAKDNYRTHFYGHTSCEMATVPKFGFCGDLVVEFYC
jgi:ankyrin repeat protein